MYCWRHFTGACAFKTFRYTPMQRLPEISIVEGVAIVGQAEYKYSQVLVHKEVGLN